MTYRAIQNLIESVFSSTDWTSHGISAFPENFNSGTNLDEFVILKVFYTRSSRYGFNQTCKKGQMLVRIFTRAGLGDKRTNEIADILDTLFENQTLGERLYFMTSDLSNHEVDNGYYEAQYQIDFTYYN